MSTFNVYAPVGDYTGESAGVVFANGKASVDASTDKGRASLAYFRAAGYRIAGDEGADLDAALRGDAGDPLAEAAAIDAEIKALEARRDLDAKRKERDKLRAEVLGKDAAEAGEGATLVAAPPLQGINPIPVTADATEEGASVELLAPPAESQGVAEWRAWAVASGRASEADVKASPRADLIARYGADYDRDRAAQLEGSKKEGDAA